MALTKEMPTAVLHRTSQEIFLKKAEFPLPTAWDADVMAGIKAATLGQEVTLEWKPHTTEQDYRSSVFCYIHVTVTATLTVYLRLPRHLGFSVF